MNTTVIWQQFHQSLHRYLVKNVKNRADADDLLQEIFIKIHLHLPTVVRSESISFWVWKLTRNTLLDYWKKKKLPYNTLEITDKIELSDIEEDETLNGLFSEFVGNFIDLLPEKSREALRLAELEHLSQKDLSQKWGISYSGAKSRVQRARLELENVFRECCEFETDNRGNIISMQPVNKSKCAC
jgi:RNA polymerase sigma-70 factor, ECF subfamily